MTPLGIINDRDGLVTVVLDGVLIDAEQLNFHPLVNTESTGLSPGELVSFISLTAALELRSPRNESASFACSETTIHSNAAAAVRVRISLILLSTIIELAAQSCSAAEEISWFEVLNFQLACATSNQTVGDAVASLVCAETRDTIRGSCCHQDEVGLSAKEPHALLEFSNVNSCSLLDRVRLLRRRSRQFRSRSCTRPPVGLEVKSAPTSHSQTGQEEHQCRSVRT